jgi:hypothetical protein
MVSQEPFIGRKRLKGMRIAARRRFTILSRSLIAGSDEKFSKEIHSLPF